MPSVQQHRDDEQRGRGSTACQQNSFRPVRSGAARPSGSHSVGTRPKELKPNTQPSRAIHTLTAELPAFGDLDRQLPVRLVDADLALASSGVVDSGGDRLLDDAERR
jgi:hypothetical protein